MNKKREDIRDESSSTLIGFTLGIFISTVSFGTIYIIKKLIKNYNHSNNIILKNNKKHTHKINNNTDNSMNGHQHPLALSLQNCKIIHFLRHARSTHNDAAVQQGTEVYKDWVFFDPGLSDLGKQQCEELRDSIEVDKLLSRSDLVLVSPLTRSIETANIVLDSFKNNDSIPWIALDQLRERSGYLPADKRCSRKALQRDFPHINFDELLANEDIMWKEEERETTSELLLRCYRFLDFIQSRPEKNIVVVTHSAFLSTLFNMILDTDEELKRWFTNAELRSCVIDFSNNSY